MAHLWFHALGSTALRLGTSKTQSVAMAHPDHAFAGDVGQEDPNNRKLARLYPDGGYCWRPSDGTHDAYFSGRQADIYLQASSSSSSSQQAEMRIGKFGVIHPEVLSKFDIPFPVSAVELNIEPFCYDQLYQALPTHLAMTDDMDMQTLQ